MALAALALIGSGGLSRAQTPDAPAAAAPVLTKAQAEEWFYLDVARCLYSLEHSGGVADLPAEAKADLRPAKPAERFMFKDAAIKVWTTDTYRDIVLLAERSPDRCDVVATKLPVEVTFAAVMTRLQQADPNLQAVPVKPGYNPIAYQMERLVDGSRFIVHLEGTDPDVPGHPGLLTGHAYRFSLLNAWVIRQPAAAKPQFR
jgi:hypothetical protein